MAKQRVPVSARAILQRINRKLKPDWKQLKTGRGLLLERTVGRYYVIDIRRNCVTQQYVDVEDLARELKVLQSWEELRAESEVAGAGKDREGHRMLWEDTTLSRQVRNRAELRDRSGDRIWWRGWGPVKVERWRIWAVGCNLPKRPQAIDGSVTPLCLPLRLRSSRRISV